MKTKLNFILMLVCLTAGGTYAQESRTITNPVRLMLPDGKVIGFDKVDSVKKAWGTDHVLFSHNEEDDRNGIIRLIPKSEEFRKAEIAAQEAQASLLAGRAPDFALTDIDGQPVSLAAFKGKVVVLNFWFIGCAPCVAEIPELNKLAGYYDCDDVVFLALARDQGDKLRSFLTRDDFSYRIVPGAAAIAKGYHVYSYPTSIIIDQDGVVRLITGSSPTIGELLRREIDTLIQAEAPREL